MASFSYSDDEDQKRGAQQDKLGAPQAPTGPTPTFAELQRRGMPRPPPMGAASQALYGAAGGAQPQSGAMAASAPPPNSTTPYHDQFKNRAPRSTTDRGKLGPVSMGPTAPNPNRYTPTGQLDQGNLEGYLYDMLANPTATPAYKDTMRHLQSGIDTEASKRGVFYSTIPVGAYGEAGAQLAAGLQGQAYDQLRGYNQDYAQLLMALLGAT